MNITMEHLAIMLQALATSAQGIVDAETTAPAKAKATPAKAKATPAKAKATPAKVDAGTVSVADLINELDSNFGQGTYNLMPEWLQPIILHLPDARIAHYLSYITEGQVREMIANVDVSVATELGVDLRGLGISGAGNTDVVTWDEAGGYDASMIEVERTQVVPALGAELWGFMARKGSFQEVAQDATMIMRAVAQ